MTVCTVTYDASSGTDAASGSQSPSTAHTDSTLSETISTATSTTHTFSGTVDLTGVADDGTDVIKIDTASGDRHLFRITSFTGGVSTCTAVVTAEAADATAGTLTWGIGGTRQTLDEDTSKPDFEDGEAGWDFELEAGTYVPGVQFLVVSGSLTDGPVTVRAASSTAPSINWIGSNRLFRAHADGYLVLENLAMTNTTSSSNLARCITAIGGGYVRAVDCTMRSPRVVQITTEARVQLINCDLQGDTDHGVNASAANLEVINCEIHDCGGNGIISVGQGGSLSILGSIIRDSVDEGVLHQVNSDGAKAFVIGNCSLVNNGDSGLRFASSPDIDNGPLTIYNNIFSENGAYGILSDDADISIFTWNDFNAFFDNFSGEVSNITKGPNSVTLSVDPFEDTAGDDYSLNETAGGGFDCKDVGLGYVP